MKYIVSCYLSMCLLRYQYSVGIFYPKIRCLSTSDLFSLASRFTWQYHLLTGVACCNTLPYLYWPNRSESLCLPYLLYGTIKCCSLVVSVQICRNWCNFAWTINLLIGLLGCESTASSLIAYKTTLSSHDLS